MRTRESSLGSRKPFLILRSSAQSPAGIPLLIIVPLTTSPFKRMGIVKQPTPQPPRGPQRQQRREIVAFPRGRGWARRRRLVLWEGGSVGSARLGSVSSQGREVLGRVEVGVHAVASTSASAASASASGAAAAALVASPLSWGVAGVRVLDSEAGLEGLLLLPVLGLGALAASLEGIPAAGSFLLLDLGGALEVGGFGGGGSGSSELHELGLGGLLLLHVLFEGKLVIRLLLNDTLGLVLALGPLGRGIVAGALTWGTPVASAAAAFLVLVAEAVAAAGAGPPLVLSAAAAAGTASSSSSSASTASVGAAARGPGSAARRSRGGLVARSGRGRLGRGGTALAQKVEHVTAHTDCCC
mmetsp:Transcript_6757/g.14133  ORF Transcript_6757/g.14133 Transcript_6757/m.14133 type:complete len:356 (+) Transcript_6757:59-1126(+)